MPAPPYSSGTHAPIEPELGELREELAREAVVAIPVGGVRLDLLPREVAGQRLDFLLLGGRLEVHVPTILRGGETADRDGCRARRGGGELGTGGDIACGRGSRVEPRAQRERQRARRAALRAERARHPARRRRAPHVAQARGRVQQRAPVRGPHHRDHACAASARPRRSSSARARSTCATAAARKPPPSSSSTTARSSAGSRSQCPQATADGHVRGQAP